MSIRLGDKFNGREIVRREKITPSKSLPSAKTVEGKSRIAKSTQQVMRIHRKALVALRDK